MTDATAIKDTPQDRIAKLLPGDVTAAFLSAKAALVSVAKEDAAVYVFWTFIAILILCPIYFSLVTRVRTKLHIAFLTMSFVVFAISIADTEFIAFFNKVFSPVDFQPPIKALSIVLPIMWTYLVTQISVVAFQSEDGAAPGNDAQPPHIDNPRIG